MRGRRLVVFVGGSAALLTLFFALGFRRFEQGLESYCDVPIERDRAETMYRLGAPPFVLDAGDPKSEYYGLGLALYSTEANGDGSLPSMPDGKRIDDFDVWGYSRHGKSETVTVNVTFDHVTHGVSEVSCFDMSDDPDSTASCPPLLGVLMGMNEEAVVNRFGQGARSQLDGPSKTISYEDLGLEIVLSKNRVYGLKLLRTRGTKFDLMRRYVHTLSVRS
jgi:hypothetical protein